jgi:Ca2+/Na+ antiporter
VGSISIASPNRISRFYFIRDTSFLLITLVILIFYGIRQKIYLINAILLFLFYVTYIATVLLTPWIEEKYSKYEMKLPSSINSNLQTAFWFQNTNTNNESSDNPLDKMARESTSDLNEIKNENEYKFLILDENIDITEEKITKNIDDTESKRDKEGDSDCDGDDQAMINLSGDNDDDHDGNNDDDDNDDDDDVYLYRIHLLHNLYVKHIYYIHLV